MTANGAKEAFLSEKRVNYNGRHGNFTGLSIKKLVYERSTSGGIEVSFVLKDRSGNSTMTAKLSECEIAI